MLLMFVEAAFALAVLGTWALLPREPKVAPSHSHLVEAGPPGRTWQDLESGSVRNGMEREFYMGELVGGWEHFVFFHILGIIIPIDSYFSDGLKLPTRE